MAWNRIHHTTKQEIGWQRVKGELRTGRKERINKNKKVATELRTDKANTLATFEAILNK